MATISGDVTFRQLTIRDGETTEDPGANLLVTSTGVLELIDVSVTGAVLHENIGAATLFDPFGAAIHVEAFGKLTLSGSTEVSGSINHHVGPGAIMVEAGATAVLQDQVLIGVPPFWANVSTQCCGGGVMVLGRLEMYDDSAITFNDGGDSGGGIYVWESGEVDLNDNARINSNSASRGGGISMAEDALVTSNSMTGAVSISDNTASSHGGGIYMQGGTLELANAEIARNDSSGSSWRRSIVWDTANVVVDAALTLPADCSMFRAVTGATTGPNRAFGLNPFFVTRARGDYRLDAVLSVNAVDQCALGLLLDLDNDPRPRINSWDRGAFEATP